MGCVFFSVQLVNEVPSLLAGDSLLQFFLLLELEWRGDGFKLCHQQLWRLFWCSFHFLPFLLLSCSLWTSWRCLKHASTAVGGGGLFVIFLVHKELLRLFSLSLTFHAAGDLVSVNTSSGTATLTSSSFLGVTSQVLYHWFGEPFHYFVNNISMAWPPCLCSGPVFQMDLLKLFTEDAQNNMTHNPTPPLNCVTLELIKINYTWDKVWTLNPWHRNGLEERQRKPWRDEKGYHWWLKALASQVTKVTRKKTTGAGITLRTQLSCYKYWRM